MSSIVGSIITDCADQNARARQELRFSSLFGVRPAFVGIGRRSPDIEAAGNLIDQLGVATNNPASKQDNQNVFLVNVAPRGDRVRKKWGNGTPFCYVRLDNSLIVSTYEGECLSLLKHLGLANDVHLLDIPTVTTAAVTWGELTKEQADMICMTQFRSLEFIPLAAYWLTQGRDVPEITAPILETKKTEGSVWCIDNFGNAKTTLVPEDIAFEPGKTVKLADGRQATCYEHLYEVPKGKSALTIGSSGYGSRHFLEVVVQWQDNGFDGSESAESRHGLHIGLQVLATA